MPVTRSAKKALRASERKRIYNLRRSRAMKDVVKQVRKLLTSGREGEARALLPQAYKAIDKAAKRGVIKGGAAARTKSRLAKLVQF